MKIACWEEISREDQKINDKIEFQPGIITSTTESNRCELFFHLEINSVERK